MSFNAISVERSGAHGDAEARDRLGQLATVGALAVGAYMAALDTSIVNAVLPVMAASFGSDLAGIEWVVTVYLLVQGGLLLAFGRLGDIWGHKRTYLLGLSSFVVSSLLCAAAPSTPLLVAARGLQAVGAALIFASLPAIMVQVFPSTQRGRALGIQATIVYLGLATGGPLGGWLTDLFGWRSIFSVNVPLGLAALLLCARYVRAEAPTGRREPFDYAGAAVYVLGLVLLLLALNQGHVWGWTSGAVLGCLLGGAALLAAWVIVELRVSCPMLDLRLFRQPAFAAPVVSALLNYTAVAATFLLPFALIQGRGLSPAQAGLVLTSQPIAMALTASVSGPLSDRIGTRLPAVLGMLVISAGQFLLSSIDAQTPVPVVSGMLLVTGVGIGLFTSPNNSAVLGAVPLARRGVANGVLGTARTLGMLLGVGLAGALYATALSDTGGDDPEQVMAAAGAGMLVASGIALLAAIASAVRPAPPAAKQAAIGEPAAASASGS